MRALHSEDMPWLRELYASTRHAELAQVTWPEASKRAFLDSQFDLQHHHYQCHYPDSDFLAIEHAGAPVGRYYLQRRAPNHLIVDISLLPDQRNRGIGSALIQASQTDAAVQGRGMQLHVRIDNVHAQRLYQRLGFVVIQEQGLHQLMHWSS